jgi:hypothetical protein
MKKAHCVPFMGKCCLALSHVGGCTTSLAWSIRKKTHQFDLVGMRRRLQKLFFCLENRRQLQADLVTHPF